ncbi:3-oxoacyl-ACP reductase [Deinococcus aerius]|uniref:3-oxoacyl-ACP reductase n=2 Tax=Deinococcus TaxID=1298 RepID=A0A2I9DIG1_9DEIO|nr:MULTISPECIES: glucose 1-dehydrogenase [Deinococcus]MBB5293599.1 NAD(P)-dependent dehydrogenase (short-subunit alcohol dehydrogenase family) [Deinococcus metallilatus]QBY07417.1 glucose 1-dehydrogenase [Deinococcus metallilatus]RXJ14890.1 glucose 1-dehydrogenase [Deinococcus metallilatus]TLK31011.1 glucose 1-dehydrogenase [Deinococcus metallilatus]GBF04521.1 3-oxoacyl-ACP reductase [Deinococcus aerius]
MSRFENKTVIVTGAASGIGLATATRFGQEGARVVIADLHGDQAQKAAEEVRATGALDALGVACDVSKADQVQGCVGQALGRFGTLDVIVNNAGLMTFKPLTDLTVEDWTRVLAVDLLGAFLFIQQGFLHMRPGGAVVNVSSIHARETEPLVAPYAAAKAALLSLTRSAAIEGKPRGIRVNAVLPGAVDTPMLWDNPNVKSGVEKINPADVGKPQDLAAAIAFLASEDAAFIQGTGLVVDGGRLDHL